MLSIVIPAKDEAVTLELIIPTLVKLYPNAEIIVVNDGSEDDTKEICSNLPVKLISHPYSKGNGAAIKTGSRVAQGEFILFMDADGQHQPNEIASLLAIIDEGYDMVVGARHVSEQASVGRAIANNVYNKLASLITGQKVMDLTSGFRVVNTRKFREFIYMLPNGFSYPSTITMAFFRSGYSVSYFPITVNQREGKSHIRPLRDGSRFLLIIFRIATLYSPLKIFIPISSSIFLMSIVYYIYTYMSDGRFTNMGAVLLLASVFVFLMGLVSEQITTLLYATANKKNE